MRSLPRFRKFLPGHVLRVVGLLALILVAGRPGALAGVSALTAIDVAPTVTLPIDFERQFTATGTFSDGTTADVTTSVAWSSSDPSIATVSNAVGSPGLATTVATGTAEIRAELDGVTGSATLTVSADRLVAIEVKPTDPSIVLGTTKNFVVAGTLSTGDVRNLTQLATWSSSDPSVATVTNGPPAKGHAVAVALGTTEIRAQSGTISGATTLTVRPPSASCAGGPFVCKTAGRASFTVANRVDDRSDVVRFAWTFGEATTMAELGAPTADTDYRVCVWDSTGGVRHLVMDLQAPAAGDCHGRACWHPIDGGGFRYVNRSRLPDGLEEMTIRPGPSGKALVRVRGRGPALPDPTMPFAQDPAILVQVVSATGACWGAGFATPADVNTAQKLVANEKP